MHKALLSPTRKRTAFKYFMVNFDKKVVWNEVLESIKVSVSDAIFSTWFSQTHLASLEKAGVRFVCEIGCPSPFAKTTLESRYFGLIQDTLTRTLGSPCDLIFLVKQIPLKEQKKQTATPLFNQDKKNYSDELNRVLEKTNLRRVYTFENFAVSSTNQMAWAAADAVFKNPGTAYNPLFIWGGVGVGKTHLMNAVGLSILKNDIDSKVLLCTGEAFTNDIVEGIRKKTTQEFRNKYRKLKALLIDDIQFIAGKEKVQEEFFHTFNTLVAAGGQVILASDTPPSKMDKMEERLRSRFEAGLIVDIAAPDFELRCAITQIKAKERGLIIPMDIIQLIAGNIDFARQIEGFLVRLSTEVNIKNKQINEELIEGLLGKGAAADGQKIKSNPNDVVAAVSKYYSIGKRDLLGTSRSRPIARPRQVLMYLLRREIELPLQEVGRLIGGRDHTTIMHGVEKITHLAKDDVNIRADIRGIKEML